MIDPTVGKCIIAHPETEELVERVLSYFWDRLSDGGIEEWPEVEMLADDMMVEEAELFELFHLLGYRQDD